MLKFSKAQLDNIEKAMQASFELRVVDYLRKAFPNAANPMTDADLLQFVRAALTRAASHELLIEWNLLRFVEYTLMFGLGFEDQPAFDWAQRILGDAGLNDTEKMDQLEERSSKMGVSSTSERTEAS
jgi:hypothetical protein